MMSVKITDIEVMNQNAERVRITLDEGSSFSCSTELVYTHRLKKEKIIDKDELRKLIEEDNYIKGKNAALRILGRSYKSQSEITDKLIGKGYDLLTIDRILAFLKQYQFIDDDKYAKAVVKDKMKVVGKNKIKYTLLKKGISEELVTEAIEQIDVEQQKDQALNLAQKKYTLLQKSETDSKKIYKKLGDFLIRKGYSWEVVKAVLPLVLKTNETDEWL